MGGETFYTMATGDNVNAAFLEARTQAQHDHGHAGYTGTIAEKHEFTMLRASQVRMLAPTNEAEAYAVADAILSTTELVDDKWGPAGCLRVGDGQWMFFGWASS